MRKLNGITIDGEYLGNSVVINGMFRAICTISPCIMRNFISIVNKIEDLEEAVKINNFNCGFNCINIEFTNTASKGIANLYFKLTNGIPELTNWKLTINNKEYTNVDNKMPKATKPNNNIEREKRLNELKERKLEEMKKRVELKKQKLETLKKLAECNNITDPIEKKNKLEELNKQLKEINKYSNDNKEIPDNIPADNLTNNNDMSGKNSTKKENTLNSASNASPYNNDKITETSNLDKNNETNNIINKKEQQESISTDTNDSINGTITDEKKIATENDNTSENTYNSDDINNNNNDTINSNYINEEDEMISQSSLENEFDENDDSYLDDELARMEAELDAELNSIYNAPQTDTVPENEYQESTKEPQLPSIDNIDQSQNVSQNLQEFSNSIAAGLTEGLGEGLSKGLKEGFKELSDGISSGLTQGLGEGLSQGLSQGLSSLFENFAPPTRNQDYAPPQHFDDYSTNQNFQTQNTEPIQNSDNTFRPNFENIDNLNDYAAMYSRDSYSYDADSDLDDLSDLYSDFYNDAAINNEPESEDDNDYYMSGNKPQQDDRYTAEIDALKAELEALQSQPKNKKELMSLDEFLEKQRLLAEAKEKKRRQRFKIVGSKERINASALENGIFVAGNKVYKWGETKILDE